MKKKIFLLMAFSTCMSNLWAYRDSVGYDDDGNGGLILACIIFGAFVIALVAGFFRNLFK